MILMHAAFHLSSRFFRILGQIFRLEKSQKIRLDTTAKVVLSFYPAEQDKYFNVVDIAGTVFPALCAVNSIGTQGR